jgi:hypothetical protein
MVITPANSILPWMVAFTGRGDEDLGVSVAIPQPTMKCDATRAQVHRLLRLCAEAEAVSARFSYHGIAHMRVTVLSILLGVN